MAKYEKLCGMPMAEFCMPKTMSRCFRRPAALPQRDITKLAGEVADGDLDALAALRAQEI
jgi:hypothetical protein